MTKVSRYYSTARGRDHTTITAMTDVLGLAGLLFVGAQLRLPLPFSPAPFTLQTLVVLTAPYFLGKNRAMAGMALFILTGLGGHAAGVSLFSTASGATLGYLLGFLLTPWLMSLFSDTNKGMLAAMASGSFMILFLGTLWLHLFLGLSFSRAMLVGFLPFVAGDVVKIGLACSLVRGCRRSSCALADETR